MRERGYDMELTTRRHVARKEKSAFRLLPAAGAAAVCFLISRACFMGSLLPAGAALIAAMVSLDAMGLYLLPFMVVGICSSSDFLWGDLGALCGCAVVFLCTSRIHLELWHKSAITGATIIISQSVASIAIGSVYPISLTDLLLEGGIGFALCGVFAVFLRMAKGDAPCGNVEPGLLSLSAVVMLAVSGSEFFWALVVSAMVLTLFFGYLLGISDGLLTGFATGFLLLLFGGSPGVVFLLMLGGMTAGIFQGKSRLAAGLCFAAVAVGAGILDVSTSLAVPFYGPIAAGGLLIFIPRRLLLRLDATLSDFLGSGTSQEKKASASVVEQLEDLRKTFDKLSALFVSQDNRRVLMSYQFQAISQVLNQAAKKARRKTLPMPPKYEVQPAWASYAKNRGISGDSYLWAQLPGQRFAVVLSDGMGKGRAAAAESSLAATTVIRLLETGLEVELVLKLLNQIMLLNAENEVFSTIDLGIFNQKTGRMRFYKVGAATTFIKRKHSVDALAHSAMPLGIVDGLKVDCVTASLNPGDQVIMVSDGVTDSKRGDLTMEWLKGTIAEIQSRDPQTMCDLIMNRAVENYGLREKDDLTVLSMRVG